MRVLIARTVFLCAAASSPSALAQTGDPTVDSAAVARSLFRTASQVTSQAQAMPLLRRAAHAWPTQPAYWVAVAQVGARMTDTAAVHEAIVRLAMLGAGGQLAADTAVQRVASLPTIAVALGQLARATAPRVAGRVIATIADRTLFAEGIDANPANGALYVASVRHRTILEVRRDGRQRDLHVSARARVGAILGVRVARDGRTLYATTAGLPMMSAYTPADSSIAAIIRVRIADGAVTGRWDIPASGTHHLLGDLAIGDDGTVYATDSDTPVLYRLRPGADTLDQLRHPLFRSLQGIVQVPGQPRLIVADYSHGLLRVDLGTNAVTRIVDADSSTSLGVDGIIWHNGSIIAVQNGIEPARIVRFVLNDSASRITRLDLLDRQPMVADEPTIGTLWGGGFVYVANSQWEKYDSNGRRKSGTVLRPSQLVLVPLPVRRAERR